jgi:5-methyltetrahydrofolate--homocysteine methyltransferase
MISVTITDASGRTLSGQTVGAFYHSIATPEALQRRHQLRPRRPAMRPYVEELSGSPTATSPATRTPACPMPSAATTKRPPTWPPCSAEFARNGWLNLVGGCCGSTPPHIAAIAESRPRLRPPHAPP